MSSTPDDAPAPTPDFVETFTRFLHEVVHRHESRQEPGEITRILDEHLGTAAVDCPVVTDRVAPWRLVDADVALTALAGDDGRLTGVTVRRGRDADLRTILRGEAGRVGTGPVDHTTMPVGPGRERRVVTSGLRLLSYAGTPIGVLQREADPEWGRGSATLEIVGADAAVVDEFRAELRRRMTSGSVLKGQVIAFSGSGFDGESLGGLTFHERPTVPPEQVVLPDGVLGRLRRHVLGMAKHREALLAAGQHLKRGVLLHGPPGTGKTHTVRHLTGQADGVTTLLLSGTSLGSVREASQLARALEPAIVVLEDCDLIAEDRDMVDSPHSMLFELLEALDGLDGDADVAFVLTTNRPDLLERALTRRPGRIDLAVEVPLPDEPARLTLFTLYADGLGFSDDALADAARRAEGVTASFAKELVRRAVLMAADAGGRPADGHLTAALDELLDDREALTRSLLGSRSGREWDDDEDDLDEEGDGHGLALRGRMRPGPAMISDLHLD